jgi:two-component system, cell cycle sensor histidine kinase and response regulator CckA
MTEKPRGPDHKGSEVILVVDDEEGVRAVVCRGLRSLGYQVLEARHGEDAINVLHDHNEPVRLLVTDMVMPEMGGAELIRTLRTAYPELKVLIISAYSRDMVEAKGVLFPGALFLHKPFNLSTLAKTIREALDAPTSQ